ncbi:hypothetical protein B0H65DRAFT_298670 [Neurospora tetraspora]|uniref:Uncharacterized protein n=1 Tax=Neurospora tetraspora TaxID=94610 RepID=A0AAE0J9D4_9PEZI|nr:hypothetical protein B0H65DRAFT_298670 [Neurospora tetraspora]
MLRKSPIIHQFFHPTLRMKRQERAELYTPTVLKAGVSRSRSRTRVSLAVHPHPINWIQSSPGLFVSLVQKANALLDIGKRSAFYRLTTVDRYRPVLKESERDIRGFCGVLNPCHYPIILQTEDSSSLQRPIRAPKLPCSTYGRRTKLTNKPVLNCMDVFQT